MRKKLFYFDTNQHNLANRAFITELVRRYNLKGSSLVDIGCGIGYFANIFSDAGVKVTACDIRETAISKGKNMFGEKINWICNDALKLCFEDKVDVVFVSGFSLYNVKDLKDSEEVTKTLMNYLKPGGLFIFICASNFKGYTGNWSNPSLAEVENHLKKFGRIIEAYTTNLQAFLLFRRFALSRLITLLSQLLLKIHKRNVWIVVTARKM